MESKAADSIGGKQQPKAIVCIYTGHDEPFYREMQTYLALWQKQGRIYWSDPAFVQQADLILLLLSPSFFATTACHTAMKSAFEGPGQQGIPIVPLLARASNWKESDRSPLKALPDNDLPIAEWEYKERAYENIREGLARLLPELSTQGIAPPERPRIFQARDLPKGYVLRPKAFNEIKHQLLHRQGNQTTAITTALRGAGGFGKTTLALALCHDPEIQSAFPDGILWVELGENPHSSRDVLNGVLATLEKPYIGAITLDEARDHWRTALDGRRYLLVIDDVWQAVALAPLLEGGLQCVRLVTTRNDQVLPEEAVRVWVDAMEPEEAIAVLRRGLPEATQQAEYRPALEALTKRLGCWPLLLTLAHGLLMDQIRYGRTIASALEVVEHAYQHRGVTAFHLEQASERYQTVERCLEVSVRHLEEFTLARYQAAARYQELAIFPEDTDIPLATLHIFWQGTGALEAWETDELCVRLHQLSLLLACDLDKGTIRLHDVMRSYLMQRAGPNLPYLHVRFLDSFQQVLGLRRWADLPSVQRYLWQHLVLHLCSASHTEALRATLSDLSYLTRKALYIDVSALEADLLLATRQEQGLTGTTTSSFFTSLHLMVVQISHLLRQASTPADMGGLLLSYLGFQSPFAAQRIIFERELPLPFLTAWHPLPETSSALLRTLCGHTASVTDCAVSPDGRTIVSTSWDRTLKVWDAATGNELLTLSGHTTSVTGCAVSPDGRFIVSASDDRTLKIWDAATGDELLTLSGHTASVTGCAVSPDGHFIVSALYDHTLKIWDAVTGAKLFTLSGHTDCVSSCAVSPDSRFIVSTSWDYTLKMWDAATGRCILTFPVDGRLFDCAFHPDGKHLITCGTSGMFFLSFVVQSVGH